MVYQCEKALGEVGDKITEDEKMGIQAEIDKVKEALKGSDMELIKSSVDALTKKFYEIAPKIYQQPGAEGAPNTGAPGADGVYDAEFTQDDNQ